MATAHFTIYDPATGEILRSGFCPEFDLEIQVQEGEELVLGKSDDRLHFVQDGVIVDRPTFGMPDTLELALGEVQSFPLPDPCTVTLDGMAHVVTGGVIEFEGAMPAEFVFRFEQWPYLPHSLKVIVQ